MIDWIDSRLSATRVIILNHHFPIHHNKSWWATIIRIYCLLSIKLDVLLHIMTKVSSSIGGISTILKRWRDTSHILNNLIIIWRWHVFMFREFIILRLRHVLLLICRDSCYIKMVEFRILRNIWRHVNSLVRILKLIMETIIRVVLRRWLKDVFNFFYLIICMIDWGWWIFPWLLRLYKLYEHEWTWILIK